MIFMYQSVSLHTGQSIYTFYWCLLLPCLLAHSPHGYTFLNAFVAIPTFIVDRLNLHMPSRYSGQRPKPRSLAAVAPMTASRR